MTFTIDKGIPLPPARGPAFGMYPFAAMVVGDSFAVPTPPNRTKEQLRSTLSACSHGFAKRQAQPQEWRFVTRFEQKDGRAVGVRIWRAPPKIVALRSLPLGTPPDAESTFVDPVKVVEAKGYRRKVPIPPKESGGARAGSGRKPRATLASVEDSIGKAMPRFVSGKGRY